MSFTATLTVGSKAFDVLYAHNGLWQRHERGRAVSGVRSGSIILILDGSEEDLLGDWATSATMRKDGKIEFNRHDQDSVFQSIEFWGASATHYFEFMAGMNQDISMMIETVKMSVQTDNDTENLSWKRQIALTNTLLRFVERTQHSNCILLRLSAERIKIDNVEHRNT